MKRTSLFFLFLFALALTGCEADDSTATTGDAECDALQKQFADAEATWTSATLGADSDTTMCLSGDMLLQEMNSPGEEEVEEETENEGEDCEPVISASGDGVCSLTMDCETEDAQTMGSMTFDATGAFSGTLAISIPMEDGTTIQCDYTMAGTLN